MSLKNKSLDRDKNGRIKRKYSAKHVKRTRRTPKWWRKLYMTRPKRRENRRVCMKVIKGDDVDGIISPLGNRKPHVYYW